MSEPWFSLWEFLEVDAVGALVELPDFFSLRNVEKPPYLLDSNTSALRAVQNIS
jgi:hypothetical protein